MRLCHVLTLFLVLCDGRPGLSRAHTQVYTAAEGQDITVKCLLYESGTWKFFCKNNCDKRENILVETKTNQKHNGRYSIEYDETFSCMYVSITDVRSSDSGTYRCEIWEGLISKDFVEFQIDVTSAATSSDPAVTPRPSLSYNGTTPQRRGPSSGHSSPSEPAASSNPEVVIHDVTPTQRGPGPSSGASSPSEHVLLPVALTAVGIFISLTLFILYWRKRDNNPQEPPVSTEYTETPQRDHEYEEIPDRNRAGPVEMCPASVSFSNTTETSTVYSLVSAPCGQTQTEDSSSKVTYSELDFTKSSSAPRSQTEAVAVTLYSTVTAPQQ